MTIKEIAALSDDPVRVHSLFGTLVLWHFIRKDGGKYFATEHGKNFLNGFVAAPEAVYTLNNVIVAVPEAEPAPRLLHTWEIAPKDFMRASSRMEFYQP